MKRKKRFRIRGGVVGGAIGTLWVLINIPLFFLYMIVLLTIEGHQINPIIYLSLKIIFGIVMLPFFVNGYLYGHVGQISFVYTFIIFFILGAFIGGLINKRK